MKQPDKKKRTNTKKESKLTKKEISGIYKFIDKVSSQEPMGSKETANTWGNMFGNFGQYMFGIKDNDLKESDYNPTIQSNEYGKKKEKYYSRPGMREDVYNDLTSDRVKKDYNHSGEFDDIYKGLKSNGKDREHNADNAFPNNKAGYKGQYNKGHGSFKGEFNLGRYRTDAGEDENGRYLSFVDKYDWNGFRTENAINFYDRIYENQWNQYKKDLNKNSNNSFSDGGNLNNMENNFLTEFNAGGSHSQNPLGGIPQGTGANGKMNTVEQGETKAGDYVFSDRLKLDENAIKRHGLPKQLKGKTMADASKYLNKSYKETNSKIDKETTEEMTERLINASEEARILHEINGLSNDNKKYLGGLLDSQNQMFFGGNNEAGPKGEGPGAGAFLGAATGALQLGQQAFGDTGIQTDGTQEAPDVNIGMGAGSGALKGAQAGMAFGPWGAAIGGIVGGVAGFAGGKKAEKEAIKADRNFDLRQNNEFRDNFAYGGFTDPIKKGKKKKTTKSATRDLTPEELKANLAKQKDPFSAEADQEQTFTAEGFNSLFGTQDTQTQNYPDLDLGKYGKVGYFNPTQDNSGRYTLSNTSKNPANPDLYKQQTDYIRKRNPDANISKEGYTPLNTLNKNKSISKAGDGRLIKKLRDNPDINPDVLQHQVNKEKLIGRNKTNVAAYGGNMYANGGPDRPKVFPVNELEEMGIQGFDRPQARSAGLQPEGIANTQRGLPAGSVGLQSQGVVGQDSLESLNQGVVDPNFIDSYTSANNRGTSGVGNTLDKAGDFLGENYGSILRYAPVAANALQLANLKKPEQEQLDRLGNRYQPDYVDERSIVNRASSEYNNVANALKGASNNSVGALRNNLLAAHLNSQKGLSDAFLQSDNINRGENAKAQQFNLGVDSTNIQQSNAQKDMNARNRASYDNNKSKLVGQIGTDIGNIGLEEMRKKYPERMGLLYDYLGKFKTETA